MAAVLDRELLVVTGKGGTGKTTVAAALGLAAARRGRRVIVVEVARRTDVPRALGPSSEVEHLSVDPEEAMEEYLVDQLPSRAAAELLVHSRTFTYLAAATPGLRELLTIGKVWDLAEDRRTQPGADPYDLVVLDAPATGHGLALLDAPRTFAATARVGRIARQARTIDAMLDDPARTGVIAVARPEELPVTEALALQERLRHDPVLVVVNGVLRGRLTAAEADRLATLEPTPPVRAALARHERARGQRAHLARLRRGTRGPVTTLPLLARTVDPAGLVALARELDRAL